MATRIGGFRRKIAFGAYEITGHAKDQMEQDGFTVKDVKAGVNSGRIVQTQRRGSLLPKYVVEGRAVDKRKIRVVCRLTASGRLRVITVFEA